MKRRILRDIALIALTFILTLTAVSAGSNIQRVTAYINGDLKITYNGELFQPKEANGTPITPIVYNNMTYLPVRTVSELIGIDVDYDSSTNTVILVNDYSEAIPFKDGNDGDIVYDSSSNNDEEQNTDITAPEVSAKIENGKIYLSWSKAAAQGFSYYKVVISKYNSSPKYPDDGYLYCITNINENSTVIDKEAHYNGGDFGGYLISGVEYYVTVTSVYENRKLTGNVVKVECP
ncbi:MAG: stalk domain-containing protein [Bacillota bacterium]